MNFERGLLYEFLKTDDKKQLLLYCSDSSIRNNIHEYLGEHSPIPNERPIYWNDIKGKLHEGIQLHIFETFMTNFLEGGKINNETTGKTEQLPSIAGAEYVSLKICQYLTDADVQEVAEKALTKS